MVLFPSTQNMQMIGKKITKWDAVELGTLLDAWLIDNGFDLDGEFNLDYQGYEYCSGNGYYVDYKLKENKNDRTK